AHGRMEALRVGAADREQRHAGLLTRSLRAEGNERRRTDLDRAGTEQVVALTVADLAAARPAGLEQRLEHLQLRRARLHCTQVAAVQLRYIRSAVGRQQQQPLR